MWVLAWPKLLTYILIQNGFFSLYVKALSLIKGASRLIEFLLHFLWQTDICYLFFGSWSYIRANLKLPNPMWCLTLKVKWWCNFQWNHLLCDSCQNQLRNCSCQRWQDRRGRMRGYTYVQYIKLCVLFGTRDWSSPYPSMYFASFLQYNWQVQKKWVWD